MTRPTPLQLQHDNFNPASAVQSFPQVRSFFGQLYYFNWRKVVIAIAGINALRFFFAATNAFQEVKIDILDHVPRLARVSMLLSAIYLITTFIELFGVLSAAIQRLKMIRLYVHLAFVSALLITTAGFVAGVAYFVFADDVIRHCTAHSVRSTAGTKSSVGFTPAVAQKMCLQFWTNESVSQVFAVILFYLVPSVLYFFLAYLYYRQSIDPAHPANLCDEASRARRRARQAIRMESLSEAEVSPLYNHSNNGGDVGPGAGAVRTGRTPDSDDITHAAIVIAGRLGAQRPYTQGAGQGRAKGAKGRELKLDAGGGGGRKNPHLTLNLSPMMHTASPYGVTPGPPSFSVPRMRGYEQGLLPVDLTSDDGRTGR